MLQLLASLPVYLEKRFMHDIRISPTTTAIRALGLLRPHQLGNVEKIRVGREFDGGYVMADSFDGIEAAYSLGINDDVSWDLEMAARGIPVFQYDHTIAALPEHHPLFHWKAKRIDGVADPANDVESLETLVHANGHAGNRNLLLKCDIEGSEWPLMQQTPSHILSQFRQIVIEVHDMGLIADQRHVGNVLWAFSKMTESHRVIHVHANNYSPLNRAGTAVFPTTLELTLVRVDEGGLRVSDETFPTAIDMPCNPNIPDLDLGQFAFE